LLLSWKKVAKRIDELMAAGRYMTKRELEHIPEYEKGVLAMEIYNFFYNQPEEVIRPYQAGMDYYEAVGVIHPQLDEPERVEEIFHSMEEVLDNTADFARNYQSMQQTLQDMTDYKNGVYSLFTPIPPAENTIPAPSLPEIPEEKTPDTVREDLQASSQYNLQIDTVVSIGLKEYRIEVLSPERAVLRDENFPLFTEEMPREEFDRKVRENLANDHLIIKWPQPGLPAENRKEEPIPENGQEKRLGETGGETKDTEFLQDSLTAAERNYHAVMELAPEVLQGKADSATFGAGASFMPLTIEAAGENRIAISHFF